MTTTEKAPADDTGEARDESRGTRDDTAAEGDGSTGPRDGSTGRLGTLSQRLAVPKLTRRQTLIAGVVAALVVALGVYAVSTSVRLGDLERSAADRAHAEKVALDYATGAADMSFEKFDEWRGRLVKGTSPELADRLRRASDQMQQLLRPLQWSSTSSPLAAKIVAQDGDKYDVLAFVTVKTTNVQAPNGIESTATYRMTLDKAEDWLITAITSSDAPSPAGK